MRRLWQNLYEYFALYLGLTTLAVLCLLWLPVATVLHLVLPARFGGVLGRYAITVGFRLYLSVLTWLGACRFDLSALDALRKQGPVIIAPNHPCLLDAVMIISRLPNVVCIMKAALLENVFFGAGARLASYIRNDTPIKMVNAAGEALRDGHHLLVFPEGTRTTRLPVNSFVGSVALIARRAGVPVQTVFIETDTAFLSKNWPLFRKPTLPIHYSVRLGKRFEPMDNARAFTATLEQYFAEEFRDRAPMPGISMPESV